MIMRDVSLMKTVLILVLTCRTQVRGSANLDIHDVDDRSADLLDVKIISGLSRFSGYDGYEKSYNSLNNSDSPDMKRGSADEKILFKSRSLVNSTVKVIIP